MESGPRSPHADNIVDLVLNRQASGQEALILRGKIFETEPEGLIVESAGSVASFEAELVKLPEHCRIGHLEYLPHAGEIVLIKRIRVADGRVTFERVGFAPFSRSAA